MAPGNWYVSPRHTVEDLLAADFATKVAIVQAQFTGWIFDHARLLSTQANPQRQHSAFAILTLTMPYFEAFTEFLSGDDSTKKSRRFFRDGFWEVFKAEMVSAAPQGDPERIAEVVANVVYEEIRCGLFHSARTHARVRLAWGLPRAIAVLGRSVTNKNSVEHKVEMVMVEPSEFAKAIEIHFEDYLMRVRNAALDSPLRERFVRTFDRRMGL